MKADFEKGTKVCSKCKRELPIEMFHKSKSTLDGLYYQCKQCRSLIMKEYQRKNKYKLRIKAKEYGKQRRNTFGRDGVKRGNNGMLKRDYELTNKQLKRRNKGREARESKIKNENPQGVVIWYSGMLNDLDCDEYAREMMKEYSRQKRCAIRGYVARVKPSENFLFDFDLEQMLKDKVYYMSGGSKKHITKWWKGEIRHWTVNDGIWKE